MKLAWFAMWVLAVALAVCEESRVAAAERRAADAEEWAEAVEAEAQEWMERVRR